MGRQRKRGINGAGSVFLRKDGRWEAKFKVEETGKYKSLYAATEKEAYNKLQEALSQQKQGILATGRDQTVKQFLEYWLEDVYKPAVGLGTYASNHSLVHKHLIPGLGHVKLQKLTHQQVQSFYAKKLKDGTSASRIRQTHVLFRTALAHARNMRLVSWNATDNVQLPTCEEYVPQVINAEQAQSLIQKAKEKNLDMLLALAVATGMREGEILSLRWDDIDLAKGLLHVSHTVNYLPKYHFVEGKPKTKTSERTIVLPQFLIDRLIQHRVVQEEKQKTASALWKDQGLVFPNRKGSFLSANTLRFQFYKVLEKAGLPFMHFHDLRHSAATILISMGVPANMVQELLGHSDVAITLRIYSSVVPSMRKDVADKMDGLFGQQS